MLEDLPLRILSSRLPFRFRVVKALATVTPFFRSRYGPLLTPRLNDWTFRAALVGEYGDELGNLIAGLPEDAVFLDIGANIGLFSILASSRLSRGRVVCFEPNPSVFRDLLANLESNRCHNVLPINAAVGLVTGFAQISFNPDHSGRASLDPTGRSNVCQEILICGVETLSALAQSLGNGMIFCKIDVEGFELKVAKALDRSGLLKNISSLYVEVDENNLRKFGDSIESLYEFFADNGFRPLKGCGHSKHYDEIFTQAV